MNIIRNPAAIGTPHFHYSHAIEVPPNARLLFLSGQVGVEADGSVPDDIETQSVICWRNIGIILADAGMEISDIVNVRVYLAREQDLVGFRNVRDRALGPARPTTVVVIAQLTRPEWLIEIEVVAAKT